MAKKAIVSGFFNQQNGDSYLFNPFVNFYDDSDDLNIEVWQGDPVLLSSAHTPGAVVASVVSSVLARSVSQGYGLSAADIYWAAGTPVATGPISYQTIVSQTGTAAPAVSGGFTPTSSYPSGTTFTWARTGAGVYTLTASTAVFSTSKTGVFITPPQNLNGSFRAVVTSSTVITITTAVQSLAVLGLLGFTATNTDALLSGTMVYVQTYA